MCAREVEIAPSIFAANPVRIHEAIRLAEAAGVKSLHIDVMDGHFVPNLSFGPDMIAAIREETILELDTHLMITNAEIEAEKYIDAGADIVTFHYEACVHSHRLVEMLHARGVRAGVAVIPSTPVAALTEMLEWVDMVLVMTVNPGFGGQAMIPSCLEKVRQLADVREKRRLSFRLEVDGGVNRHTLAAIANAGADIAVAGTAFFGVDEPAILLRRAADLSRNR